MKDVQIHIVDFHDIDDMFLYTQTRLHKQKVGGLIPARDIWMWICMWTRIRCKNLSSWK